MATWPAELPQAPLLADFSESAPNNVLASPTTIGPPLRRKMSTAAERPLPSCSVIVESTALREIARTFFQSDCAYGAVPFLWAKLSEKTGGGTGNFLLNGWDFRPLGRDRWRIVMQISRVT